MVRFLPENCILSVTYLNAGCTISPCSSFFNVLLFRPLKMGRTFVFGCVFFLLFVFHAKSGTIKNDRTGLSEYHFKAVIYLLIVI